MYPDEITIFNSEKFLNISWKGSGPLAAFLLRILGHKWTTLLGALMSCVAFLLTGLLVSCDVKNIIPYYHDRLSLDLSQLMRLFPTLTHLLAIIVNLILLQAKVKFILLILYKYTIYRLKLKININKKTNLDFCFLSIDISKFLIQNLKFNCMFGTWYITYFLIIFQMESEEGEEMEVARDVVVIPIRDRSEESVSPYSTEYGDTLIQIANQS